MSDKMWPCSECGSAKANRFQVPRMWEEPAVQCYDLVGCKRRWKAKQAAEIVEACKNGRHAAYVDDRCVDCGATYEEGEVPE